MDCSAAWSNYGAGLAGTNGVPNFTSNANPVLGTTITLALDNSLGVDTTGFVIAGLSEASVLFKKGTLLVGDIFLTSVLPISAAGESLDVDIPDDVNLCELHVHAQVLELDPGAARKISFTSGLDLLLGR